MWSGEPDCNWRQSGPGRTDSRCCSRRRLWLEGPELRLTDRPAPLPRSSLPSRAGAFIPRINSPFWWGACVCVRACVCACVLGGVVPGIVNIELFFFFLCPSLLFNFFFFLRWENCETHLDFLPSPSSPPSLAPSPDKEGRSSWLNFW